MRLPAQLRGEKESFPPPILPQTADNDRDVLQRNLHVWPHVPEALGVENAEGFPGLAHPDHRTRLPGGQMPAADLPAFASDGGQVGFDLVCGMAHFPVNIACL